MLKVEVGFKLEKDYEYYDSILKANGLCNDFNCETYDIYYAKDDLGGLTENEIKQRCIRLRKVNFNDGYNIENCLIDLLNLRFIKDDEIVDFENILKDYGYLKVFDTRKKDHHYFKDGMTTKVQLQEIENIGLLVYLDNSVYYEFQLDEQRNKLIDELNSYGFNFKYDNLGLDKLRTLYYREKKYSKNQNG